jgi:hypothetical protein
MKRKQKIGGTLKQTVALLTAALLLLMPITAMAGEDDSSSGSSTVSANTPVSGSSEVTFKKYLTMKSDASIPNETFTFTIAAGDHVDARVVTSDDGQTTSYPEILPGIIPENTDPTVTDYVAIPITSAVFSPTDTALTTYDSVQTDDTITLESGWKYAKQTCTVDLSKVSFTDPGIYRYVITETAVTAADDPGIAIYNNENTRVLDVYVDVKSGDENALEIVGYLFHSSATEIAATTGGTYENKPDGFINTYTTYDLTLEKQVEGNQGNRNEFFTFNIVLSGAKAGTVYTVSTVDGGKTTSSDNPATLTAGSDGTLEATFKLKDDQSITIQGLTAATSYTITEDLADTKGYTVSYVKDTDTSDEETLDALAGKTTGDETTIGESSDKVVFTNTRTGVVPTGILMETAPYAAVILLAAGMILILTVKRRRA